jgi:hypothetical protein
MPNERRQRSERRSRQAVAADLSGGPSSPTYDQVRSRAYELYEARGCEDGHDLDDWLQAELELRGRTRDQPV